MARRILGDLLITNENKELYKDITAVSGRLKIKHLASLELQCLKTAGAIELDIAAELKAPIVKKCNLIYLRGGARLHVPALTKAGSISMFGFDTSLHIPKLTKIFGNIYLNKHANFEAPNLKEISGDIDVKYAANLDAPVLGKIHGYVEVETDAVFHAPLLTEISGNISLNGPSSFQVPTLTTIAGSVCLESHADLEAPELIKSGTINLYSKATLHTPKLLDGYFSVVGNVTLPTLTNAESIDTYVDSNLYAPSLVTCESVNLVRGSTLDAPALTEASWINIDVDATLRAPVLTKAKEISMVDNSGNATLDVPQTKGLHYKFIDETLFVIEAERALEGYTIYHGYVINEIAWGEVVKQPRCYAAEKNDVFAHGETIRKAIADLEFKISREKIKHDPIYADTMITIMDYRMITGACEFGVKNWMQQNQVTEESMRADELLPLLRNTNAYGFEKIEALMKKANEKESKKG